jgi:hypothetical protein
MEELKEDIVFEGRGEVHQVKAPDETRVGEGLLWSA